MATLANGQERIDSIGINGSETYDISVTAGERVVVSVGQDNSTGGFGGEPFLRLFDETGTLVGSDSGTNNAFVEITASNTATYSAVVTDSFDDAAMGFRIRAATLGSTPNLINGRDEFLSNGEEEISSVPLGGVAFFPIDVIAGERVVVSVGQDNSLGGIAGEPFVKLYDANGNFLTSDSGNDNAFVEVDATTSGRYTAMVLDSFADTAMDFRIRAATLGSTPNLIIGRDEFLSNGETYTAQNPLGTYAVFPFNAQAGDEVTISVNQDAASTGLDGDPVVAIYSPNGSFLTSTSGSNFASVTFTPSLSGTHKAIVVESFNDEAMGFLIQGTGIAAPDSDDLHAVNDSTVTVENASVIVDVQSNDQPAGNIDTVGVGSAANGTVTLNNDGTITYAPNAGFSGNDSFNYIIARSAQELQSGAASAGDRFGYSVAIDGSYAVVGTYLDDPNGITNAGSAFVYRRTNSGAWTQIAQLNGDLNGDDAQSYFGWDVAIAGDTVAVSAQLDRDQGFRSGAVYIFDRNEGGINNWGRVTKFSGLDTDNSDYFGRSIDLSGDTLVVGASIADPLGAASGAAYVFDRNEGGANQWGQVKKLTGSTQAAGDRFGQSVSIDGNSIAVGAFRNDTGGTDTGAVYIFTRNRGGTNNWGELKAITAPDAAAQDFFGYSVSISGNRVAVGAPLVDTNGQNQIGAVYIMDRNLGGNNNWGQLAKLQSENGERGDRLGWSVDFNGSQIVTGAPQADRTSDRSGNAYLFENINNNWVQTRELVNEQVTQADEYGVSVALGNGFALVGSWLDNRPNNNSGGAYAFDLETDTANVTVTVTANGFFESNSVAANSGKNELSKEDQLLNANSRERAWNAEPLTENRLAERGGNETVGTVNLRMTVEPNNAFDTSNRDAFFSDLANDSLDSQLDIADELLSL